MPDFNIVPLQLTETALEDLYANSPDIGPHPDDTVAFSDLTLSIATQPLNPLTNDPRDMASMSLETIIMQDITGVPHVPVGLTRRPLAFNIVTDMTPRQQITAISQQKTEVSGMMAESLRYAIPHRDPVSGSLLGPGQIMADEYDINEVIAAETRDEAGRYIEELALSGLLVVLSDFRAMRFAPGSLENAVAVKVNHVLEREVPASIGPVSLGEDIEIDTNNPRQLADRNTVQQQEHELIVANLQRAGAVVVSLVADPRLKPYGCDTDKADEQLAAAFAQLTEQA